MLTLKEIASAALKDMATAAMDEFASKTEDASVFNGLKHLFDKQNVRKPKNRTLAEHDKVHHPNGFSPDHDYCSLRAEMSKFDGADSKIDGGNGGSPRASVADRVSTEVCDITKQKVDAIVNAANKWMLGGGGVDYAIHKAAGPQLVEECRTYPPDENGYRVQTGDAKITKGYNLPSKHVIHTAGPDCRDREFAGNTEAQDNALASSYRRSLEVAKENGCKSVAFPSISTGIFGFPLERAAGIAANEITSFLTENPDMSVKMCVYDPVNSNAIKAAYDKAFAEKSESTSTEDEAVLDAAPAKSTQTTDLQRHDAIYHGGTYDGKSKCKYREAMARGDDVDACVSAEGEERAALEKAIGPIKRVHPQTKPEEPPPWDGLSEDDFDFLEKASQNLAYLARRVNRNIENGAPSAGTKALQEYQAIDKERLSRLAAKDITGQAKVLKDVYDEAAASEKNGWKDIILKSKWDSTKYSDPNDPLACVDMDSWYFTRAKCPVDPYAKQRAFFANWEHPSKTRSSMIGSLAKMVSSARGNDLGYLKDALDRAKKADSLLSDFEDNIAYVDSAIERATDQASKKALGDLLEELEIAYAVNLSSYESSIGLVDDWAKAQNIMGDSIASTIANIKSRGETPHPLLVNWQSCIDKHEKVALNELASRFILTPQEKKDAPDIIKRNFKAVYSAWEKGEISIASICCLKDVMSLLNKGWPVGCHADPGTWYGNISANNFGHHNVMTRTQGGLVFMRAVGREAKDFPNWWMGECAVFVKPKESIIAVSSDLGAGADKYGVNDNGSNLSLMTDARATVIGQYLSRDAVTQDLSGLPGDALMKKMGLSHGNEFHCIGGINLDRCLAIKFYGNVPQFTAAQKAKLKAAGITLYDSAGNVVTL